MVCNQLTTLAFVCCWGAVESGTRDWGVEMGQLGIPEESLLESREAACLADEDISDLAHLDADEEHGVTGVLLVQALTKCLQDRRGQRQPEPGEGPLPLIAH